MALAIMFILLMIQLGKLGFIVFRINLTYLIVLINGKLWLRIRQERDWSALDQIIEVNTATRRLMIVFHRMEFIRRI